MNVEIRGRLRLRTAPALLLLVCQDLLRDDTAQDLIEYALVFSFVALGAVATMESISASVAGVFAAVGTTLTSAT